jgi:hypothetical protein
MQVDDQYWGDNGVIVKGGRVSFGNSTVVVTACAM